MTIGRDRIQLTNQPLRGSVGHAPDERLSASVVSPHVDVRSSGVSQILVRTQRIINSFNKKTKTTKHVYIKKNKKQTDTVKLVRGGGEKTKL